MNWFNDMKIGTKLTGGFVFIALICAIVGIIGMIKMRQIESVNTKMYENMTVPIGDLAFVSMKFMRGRMEMENLVKSKNENEKITALNALDKLRKEVYERIDNLDKIPTSVEERKVFDAFNDSRKKFSDTIGKVIQLVNEGKNAEAAEKLFAADKTDVLLQQDSMQKLMEIKVATAKSNAKKNINESHSATMLMAVLQIMSAFLAVGLGLVVAKKITRSLKEAVYVANTIADGDLRINVEVRSKDETGQLLSAMQHMVQNLREMISNTAEISTCIATSSHELKSISSEIAAGVDDIASQTNMVATASEEMSATSSEIAGNCSSVADASHQTIKSANAGAEVVNETISGMNVIADRVRQASDTIAALGVRSEQIGDIVGTIEDIADQTNLLALNAAIEAARAGEQGRGFAVVADEVRALAERTTRATREIGEKIKAMQNDTCEAIKAMNLGVIEVEKGSAYSHKSGQALTKISESINEVTMQISQIATAAEQQTATTGEVNSNIQQITKVIDHAVCCAGKTAESATQLTDQAVRLQTLMGRFCLQ